MPSHSLYPVLVTMNPLFPPTVPPLINIPHQLVGAPVGYSFALECIIEAHPKALTYWTRGSGEMIHHSEKFFIEDEVR